MKLEDAPNKQVHAEDLAEALAKLHHRGGTEFQELPASPTSDVDMSRGRSGSTTISLYRPEEHGNSPGLPAVTVEDCGDFVMEGGWDVEGKPILAHTSRPPVELMEQ